LSEAGPLAGEVAVVTGASRGIGKAIALRLARDGCDVAICARTDRPAAGLPGSLLETQQAIEALGRRALAVRADLAVDDDIAGLHKAVMNAFGRADVLVNNAAVQPWYIPFLDEDVSRFDEAYRLNVRAPFLLSQRFAASMAQQGGGVIVNVSSVSARLPRPPGGDRPGPPAWASVVYGPSKAAFDRLSLGLAHELFAAHVAVVTLYPGFTATELIERQAPPGLDASQAETPDGVCDAVATICRDPMRFTGRALTWCEVVGET
jgi:NAD(P)-dependent dehydrogenase (short-subunit alcohol dehydrogenase family)